MLSIKIASYEPLLIRRALFQGPSIRDSFLFMSVQLLLRILISIHHEYLRGLSEIRLEAPVAMVSRKNKTIIINAGNIVQLNKLIKNNKLNKYQCN